MTPKLKYSLFALGFVALLAGPALANWWLGAPAPSPLEGQVAVYFIDLATNSLVPEYHPLTAPTDATLSATVNDLLARLTTPHLHGNASILREVAVLGYEFPTATTVRLHLSDHYHHLPLDQALLIRAGLVDTLTGIAGIDAIYLYINGESLTTP